MLIRNRTIRVAFVVLLTALLAGCAQPQQKPIDNTSNAINMINSDPTAMADGMSAPETRDSMIQIMSSDKMRAAMTEMMKIPQMQQNMRQMMTSPEARESMINMMSDPSMKQAMSEMMQDSRMQQNYQGMMQNRPMHPIQPGAGMQQGTNLLPQGP